MPSPIIPTVLSMRNLLPVECELARATRSRLE
jgi:hypothetical protein